MVRIICLALAVVGFSVAVSATADAEYTCPRGTRMVKGVCVPDK